MQEVYTAPSLKNIRVIGFVYDGNATDVDLIMNLAKDIACDGSTVDYTGIDSEGVPQFGLIPIIEGTLNIAGSVYEDSANFVRDQYPNLVLNVTGGYYIRFADKTVQDICAANWGDGLGITEAQAAATTSFDTKFKGNSAITEFMELGKFGVTSIVANGFNGCTNLIKADLSKISALNNQAFINCVNFAGDGSGDLRLPSLTSIGSATFGGYNTVQCIGLKKVLDLGSITIIPNSGNNSGGFRNQINLTEVHLPETLTTIGSACFENCSSLTDISLPPSLTTINEYAFNNCTSLVDINLPSSITSINKDAFRNCSALAIVIDLPNLETLGEDAFCAYDSNIGSLIGIENLGKITKIATDGGGSSGCFRNQKSLTYAKLPSTLTDIGTRAFYGCSALNDITLPSSITNIGYAAFENCTALEIEDLSLPNLKTIGTQAFSKVKITKISNLGKLTSLQNVYGSENIFGDKTTLTSVNLPDTLTSVGNYIFSGYTALASVNLPLSLTRIGTGAFGSCASLVDVTLPTSLTTIGANAFASCTSLAIVINLPNLETLGQDAFCMYGSTIGSLAGIENLGKITTISNANGSNYGCFRGQKSLTYAKLPNTLTTIGSYAFYGCSALANVDFPSSLTTIGAHAFAYALDDADCSFDNLTSLDVAAFYRSGLRSFSAPLLETIPGVWNGLSVFSNCSKLKTINIPNVKSIPSRTFENCAIEGQLNLNATSIGFAAFKGNKITSLVCSEGLETISGSGDSWMGSFNNCTLLTYVDFPSTVTSIGKQCFYQCSQLVTFICRNATPPTLGAQVFDSTNAALSIYVPDSAVDTYKEATGWAALASRIKPLSEYVE